MMGPSAITSQPTTANQMTSFPVPSGLESLDRVDHFVIKQKMVTVYQYDVFDKSGQQMFTVVEDKAISCCNRFCCGSSRSFNMIISDMQGQEVMHLVKPFNCHTQVLVVTGSDGETAIGSVDRKWWSCGPKFLIKDELEETVHTVARPFSVLRWRGDIDFTLTSQDIGL